MVHYLYIEVEENENCEYMPLLIYEARADEMPVKKVRLFDSDRPDGSYQVTGWTSDRSGTPCIAKYAPVSDSGQAVVHLVWGGDWGIRLKPDDSEEAWDIDSPNQWGEPYLMLTDETDILLDD